jgi:hypothetical protein
MSPPSLATLVGCPIFRNPLFSHILLALREVAEYLAGQTLAVDVETVSLAQHFPRFVSFSGSGLSTRTFSAGKYLPNRTFLNLYESWA